RLFLQLPFCRKHGILPLAQFPCRDLVDRLLIGIAELPDERDLSVPDAQDGRAARMLDHLPLARLPVGEHRIVAAQIDDLALVDIVFADSLFGEPHTSSLYNKLKI